MLGGMIFTGIIKYAIKYITLLKDIKLHPYDWFLEMFSRSFSKQFMEGFTCNYNSSLNINTEMDYVNYRMFHVDNDL